ncbi:MAG: hypothetical protein QXV09_05710 [Candidatus Bathyarchaeia archaeon]
MTSHLTTLVTRFLRALENVKSWNQLDSLTGGSGAEASPVQHHRVHVLLSQAVDHRARSQAARLPLGERRRIPAVTLQPKLDSSTRKQENAGDFVYVRYLDHVLFRNADAGLFKPALRETVGWLHRETADAIWLLWERSVKPLPHEMSPSKESGLVLLRSDIVEMRRLPLQKRLNGLLFRSSALTFNCRVSASEREAKNSARKKPEETRTCGNT